MKILVTGSAGFIGFHVSKQLLERGVSVVGLDAFTPYYEPKLKRDRSAILESHANFELVEGQLEDADMLSRTVRRVHPEVVVHLAAQAGVRYSIENPDSYIQSNVIGTANLLEALRQTPPRHFMFASTSSVYGGNQQMPFGESDRTDFPMSLYAATKKAGEAMSHSYAHLFNIPTTCFRFFTVYGPWGRPDMALFKFVDRISAGTEIEIYGEGEMSRDFTYIDDLVESIIRLMDLPPAEDAKNPKDSLSPVAPWRVVNIAGGNSVGLGEFVSTVEMAMGQKAKKKYLPMQDGDVTDTQADATLLNSLTGYRPETPIAQGVEAFVDWYRSYPRGNEVG